ncbi:MAG: dockerin type I domain-containing protein [Chthoniobacterales bacterium]
MVSTNGLGSDGHQYVINLTGVTNAQDITVTLNNVTDLLGSHSNTITVTLGLLVGDVNGDAVVNSADATLTRNRSGQATDATNFRTDFNVDAAINSADATIVRARSGQFIPPPPEPSHAVRRFEKF